MKNSIFPHLVQEEHDGEDREARYRRALIAIRDIGDERPSVAVEWCKSIAKEALNGDGGEEAVRYKAVVSYLNAKAGTHFRHSTTATRRCIKARWREGFRYHDFTAVIDDRVAKWGADEQMVDYLRPQTLFGTKFESYLESARRAQNGNHTVAAPRKDVCPECGVSEGRHRESCSRVAKEF